MRVFLPATLAQLAELVRARRLEPPSAGHAVTARLIAAWPDEIEEGRDYAALMAAAFDSLLLLAGTDERRRVVIAADVPLRVVETSSVTDADELTAVVVTEAVGIEQVVSVHVDDAAAATDVDAALTVLPAALDGDAAALDVVALEDHELLWYARQEIPDLLT